jgi:hypothetical protein
MPRSAERPGRAAEQVPRRGRVLRVERRAPALGQQRDVLVPQRDRVLGEVAEQGAFQLPRVPRGEIGPAVSELSVRDPARRRAQQGGQLRDVASRQQGRDAGG